MEGPLTVILASLGAWLLILPHLVGDSSARRHGRWSVNGTRLGLRLIEAAALLTAAPAALRALEVDAMADACHRIASPIPADSLVGHLALVAALGILARTVIVRWRVRSGQRPARIESSLGEHRPLTGHADTELVVLPSGAWIAYALPGHPHQVVISSHVEASLSSTELEALLEHEAAHIRLGHDKALRLLAELDGLAGMWSRRLTDRVRTLLERAADEAASTVCGRGAVHAALCAAPGSAVSTKERTDRLLGPSPKRALPLLPIGVIVSAFFAVGVLTAAARAADHGVLGVLGFCGL